MRTAEIRERTDDELKTLASQLRDDMFKLRVQRATNQLENTGSLTQIRKDIARVETVMHARKLGLEESRAGR